MNKIQIPASVAMMAGVKITASSQEFNEKELEKAILDQFSSRKYHKIVKHGILELVDTLNQFSDITKYIYHNKRYTLTLDILCQLSKETIEEGSIKSSNDIDKIIRDNCSFIDIKSQVQQISSISEITPCYNGIKKYNKKDHTFTAQILIEFPMY